MELDVSVQMEFGEIYSEEIWNEQNFLFELPGKWDYSKLALDENDKLCGFWIASISSHPIVGVYTHRVAVKKEYRGCGIAKQMFLDLFSNAKQNGFNRMTLSVSILNDHAIAFYESLGFIKLSNNELMEFIEHKGLKASMINDYVQEKNGHKKFIYALSI